MESFGYKFLLYLDKVKIHIYIELLSRLLQAQTGRLFVIIAQNTTKIKKTTTTHQKKVPRCGVYSGKVFGIVCL